MKAEHGLLLGGRYRLIDLLATGGMGEVWKAQDEAVGRTVAVKVLREEFTGNQEFLRRLRTEARNSAALSHQNIAQMYDYGEQEGTGFLVMELVPGEPLADLLDRKPVLPPAELLPILASTARGLHHAHQASVVHRDVKPGNILLDSTDKTAPPIVKITDFGVSLAANQAPMTATGMVMGTAQYLSPEQAIGKPATARSDLYALGVIAYEATAGKRPFTGKSPVDIAIAHVNDPVPPLPTNVDPRLAEVIMRLLEKEPEARYADAGVVADEFDRLNSEIASGVGLPLPLVAPTVLPAGGEPFGMQPPGMRPGGMQPPGMQPPGVPPAGAPPHFGGQSPRVQPSPVQPSPVQPSPVQPSPVQPSRVQPVGQNLGQPVEYPFASPIGESARAGSVGKPIVVVGSTGAATGQALPRRAMRRGSYLSAHSPAPGGDLPFDGPPPAVLPPMQAGSQASVQYPARQHPAQTPPQAAQMQGAHLQSPSAQSALAYPAQNAHAQQPAPAVIPPPAIIPPATPLAPTIAPPLSGRADRSVAAARGAQIRAAQSAQNAQNVSSRQAVVSSQPILRGNQPATALPLGVPQRQKVKRKMPRYQVLLLLILAAAVLYIVIHALISNNASTSAHVNAPVAVVFVGTDTEGYPSG